MPSKRTLKQLVRESICDTEVQQKAPYTFARVRIFREGIEYQGLGFTKCKPDEEFIEERGRMIAKGRAVKDIVDQMLAKQGGHWAGTEISFSFPSYQPLRRDHALPQPQAGAFEVK